MPDLKDLKLMLQTGVWAISQAQKERNKEGNYKILFEELPGPLAFSFFENNIVKSLEQDSEVIFLKSEGFDAQTWEYKLIRVDKSG